MKLENPQLPLESIIRMKDLANLEKIGEGMQGVVYKAQWRGQVIIYKHIKRHVGDEKESFMKESFMKEFSVWRYVIFFEKGLHLSLSYLVISSIYEL